MSDLNIFRVGVGEKLTSFAARRLELFCRISSFESQVLAVSAGCEERLEDGGQAVLADKHRRGGPFLLVPPVKRPFFSFVVMVISNSLASMSISSLTFSATPPRSEAS